MYNKYVGKREKYYPIPVHGAMCPPCSPGSHHDSRTRSQHHTPTNHEKSSAKKPSLFSGDSLKSIKSKIDSALPFGMDSGDLILLLLLFLLYLDSGDEEFLIILAVLAYGFFQDRNKH